MSCRHRLVPLLLCCVLSLCALGQRRVSWHHSASPYRAVFDLKRSSNHDQGATVIEVPHGGAGDPDGADVHCYDEQGRQLRRSHYGRSSQDRSLILVRPEAGSRQVYAYFGSGSPAPRVPFLPPLLCEARTLPKGPCRSRAKADKLLAGSKLVGRLPVDRICQVANPLSSDERFAMVFTGCLNMPADGTKILFGAASGPWYLYLDDKPEPVLFREQVAGGYGGSIRGEHRKEIELKKGVHPLRFVVLSTDGDQRFLAALGRCRMKGKEVAAVEYVAGNEWVQNGEGVLKAVEGRNRQASVPQFTYRHLSYMSLEDIGFITETELSTFSGQEAEWIFADGIVMRGAKVTRLFADLSALSVKVRVKRAIAEGKVMFSQIAPQQRLASRRQDFDHYVRTLKAMNAGTMTDASELRVLLGLLQFEDRQEMQVPLAQAYLRLKRGGRFETQALLCLARSGSVGARRNPAIREATDAWQRLLKTDDSRDLAAEAIEFAVFCLRDLELARRWLATYGPRLSAQGRISLLMDIALQEGKLAEAAAEYGRLMEGRRFGDRQRSAAVRGSSFAEEAERAVAERRYNAAREALQRWAVESPMDRGNGAFSLVRARLFHRLGWLEGAEGELRGAIRADRELPNLVDVEYQLALVLRDLKRRDEASRLFRHIAKDYPNHPKAAEAAKQR